jgi:hypothetical protein
VDIRTATEQNTDWLVCIWTEHWLTGLYLNRTLTDWFVSEQNIDWLVSEQNTDWLVCIWTEHWLTGLYLNRTLTGWFVSEENIDWIGTLKKNRDGDCLLRGTDWIFIYNSGYSLCLKGWGSAKVNLPIMSPVVTICTRHSIILRSAHTECICVFCVDLKTNSDYFPIQH